MFEKFKGYNFNFFRIQPVAQGNARTSNSELVLSGYKIPKNVNKYSLLLKKHLSH
jgi:hypothetical protein